MKIGVALSGDGIKGAAAEGVLCALKDLSINIDGISATGSASLPATLFACNVPSALSRIAIEQVLKKQNMGIFRYKLSRLLGRDRSSNNDFLEKRLSEHRNKTGKSAKYIRYFDSFQLVYSETFNSRSEAMKREWQLKQWSRTKKEALIRGDIGSKL